MPWTGALPHPLARHFPGRTVAAFPGSHRRKRTAPGGLATGRRVDQCAGRGSTMSPGESRTSCWWSCCGDARWDGPRPVFLAALSDPVIHDALRHIHTQLDRAWHVPEMAETVGLSRAAFAERFHQRVGEPAAALPPVLADAQGAPRVAPVWHPCKGHRGKRRIRIRRRVQTRVSKCIRTRTQFVAIVPFIRITRI